MCFAVNLALAAWIKFKIKTTPAVVTAVLAVSLVFVARLLAFWAPHLFSRNRGTDDSVREHVLQLGEDTGMPFAWHRVPHPGDMLRVCPRLLCTTAAQYRTLYV